MLLRKACLTIAAAAVAAAPAFARVPQPLETVQLPPSLSQGLDMILVDADAMPPEPELARDVPEVQDESFSGAPIDLLKPLHHLYTDFRRQLVRYQREWSGLPQVRVPAAGPIMARGSTDPRVPILRERIGLSRQGGFDEALQARLVAYQEAHGLPGDGKAGAQTLASLNRGAAYYERLILLNMERARRLPPSDVTGRYVLVDAGAARLWMYENGRVVDSMKVIVGTAESATPMMAALMRYASVNPYWNVPPDLVRKTIAPRVLSEGLSYLATKQYQVLDSWNDDARVVDPASVDWRAVADGARDLRVRQLPGAGNFMGEIKFMMPNEYGIYLHDTPKKELFNEDERWLSNGCIRVEDARRLARWLFGRMPQAPTPDREHDVQLERPVPVYVTYLTVGADSQRLAFRSDRYGRDAKLLARFDGAGMSDAQTQSVSLAVDEPRAAAAIKAAATRPAPAKGSGPKATPAKASPTRAAAGKAVPAKSAPAKAAAGKTAAGANAGTRSSTPGSAASRSGAAGGSAAVPGAKAAP